MLPTFGCLVDLGQQVPLESAGLCWEHGNPSGPSKGESRPGSIPVLPV